MTGDAGRPPPPRPAARGAAWRTTATRVATWLEWFGPVRLAVFLCAAVAVVIAGAWLVRVPPPVGEVPSVAGTDIESPVFTSPVFTLVPPRAPVDQPLVVHVAGAVRSPGVHEIQPGARVITALEAAGGPRPDAVLDALNLAAPVTDGQRIYVPVEGEEVPAIDQTGSTATPGPLDLNSATLEQLVTLPGVGPVTAGAIIDHRERNGPFSTVDELVRVRGIGPGKLAALEGLVAV